MSDEALTRACQIVHFMLADRADVRERLFKFGKKFAVLGEYESITETPEYKRIYKITNRSRIRGLGGTVDKLGVLRFYH